MPKTRKKTKEERIQNMESLFQVIEILKQPRLAVFRELLLQAFTERNTILEQILSEEVVELSIACSLENLYVGMFDVTISNLLELVNGNLDRFFVEMDNPQSNVRISLKNGVFFQNNPDQLGLGEICRVLNAQLAVRNQSPLSSLDIVFLDKFIRTKSVYGIRFSQIWQRNTTDLFYDERLTFNLIECVFRELGNRHYEIGLLPFEQLEVPRVRTENRLLDYQPYDENAEDFGDRVCVKPQFLKELISVPPNFVYFDGHTAREAATNLLSSRNYVESNRAEMFRWSRIAKADAVGFNELTTDYMHGDEGFQLIPTDQPKIIRMQHHLTNSVACLMSYHLKSQRNLEYIYVSSLERSDIPYDGTRNMVDSMIDCLQENKTGADHINSEVVVETQVEALSKTDLWPELGINEQKAYKQESTLLIQRPASLPAGVGVREIHISKYVAGALPFVVIGVKKALPSQRFGRGVLATVTMSVPVNNYSPISVNTYSPISVNPVLFFFGLVFLFIRVFYWLQKKISSR